MSSRMILRRLSKMKENIEKKTSKEKKPQKVKKQSVPVSVRMKNYFNPQGIQLDMLRYRPNKVSYTLGLLAAVFLAVGFCCFYSGTELGAGSDAFNLLGSKKPGPWLGVDIVINILMMLFMLFSAMRMKDYSLQMGYFSIGMGAFQIIRIFLLPLSLMNCGTMKVVIFFLVLGFYLASGICSVFGGFLSIYRGTALRKYLKTVNPIENEKVGK